MLSRYKAGRIGGLPCLNKVKYYAKKKNVTLSGQHIFPDLEELKAITCLVNIGFHVSRSLLYNDRH